MPRRLFRVVDAFQKDIRSSSSFPVLRFDEVDVEGRPWAHLCFAHHQIHEDAISSGDAKRLCDAYFQANGGLDNLIADALGAARRALGGIPGMNAVLDRYEKTYPRKSR